MVLELVSLAGPAVFARVRDGFIGPISAYCTGERGWPCTFFRAVNYTMYRVPPLRGDDVQRDRVGIAKARRV